MSKRSKRLGVLLITFSLAAGGAVWMYGGCTTPPIDPHLRVTEERSRNLMAMAAAEAADIPDIDQRLTRQLNLADLQINRAWKDDAKNTLSACRDTLKSPDASKLKEHARMSGWVSVSELCRGVGDKDGAAIACDGAVAELHNLADPAVRCQYVMGVSNELQYIKGKPAAAQTLEEAGPWTKSIDNVDLRRRAVISFATALFNLDEFSRGQAMLKNEGDASWRSDMLAQLAMQAPPPSAYAQRPADKREAASMSAVRAEMAPTAAPRTNAPQAAVLDESRQADLPGGQNYFGKDLQYRSVFQNQKVSNTGK
jgi:hypothetical protein